MILESCPAIEDREIDDCSEMIAERYLSRASFFRTRGTEREHAHKCVCACVRAAILRPWTIIRYLSQKSSLVGLYASRRELIMM